MKLSTSLLALCGVYADYACCPYDDFGAPDAICVAQLSERTAWADGSNEQKGLTENACKAWEANTDATFDGNEQSENNVNEDWGGCGFQRHFPWDFPANSGSVGITGTDYVNHLLGVDATDLATNSATAFNWMDDSAILNGGIQDVNNRLNRPFGRVALDGVCKLFIPVDMNSIQYVTIAGVHMRGGGSDSQFNHGGAGEAGCSAEGCAVFDSQINSGGATPTKKMDGTSFCFTVANDAEGYENTNSINNGNVAGDGNDDANSDLPWQSKHEWAGYDSANGAAQTNSKLGNNFDVVVHLKSDYCKSHWTEIDMQTGTEEGAGSFDYPFPASWEGGDVSHAHTDMYDKRIDGGSDGSPVAGHGSNGQGAGAINTYSAPNDFLWPNVGSWAGYYSFVSCDFNNDPVGMATNAIYNLSGGDVTRMLVLSSFNHDYRHDSARQNTVNIRGNVRQVGTEIRHCGIGNTVLPDSAAGADRCSWNWNMNTSNNEAFWNDVSTWSATATGSHLAAANLGFNTIDPTTLDFNFELHLGGTKMMADGNNGGFSAAASVGWDNEFLNLGNTPLQLDCATTHGCSAALSAPSNKFLVTIPCVAASDQPGNTGFSAGGHPKDSIPDCFFGEEIWFELDTASTGADYVSSFFSKAIQTTGDNNT